MQTITYQSGQAKKVRPEDCVSDNGLRFEASVPVKTIALSAPEIEGLRGLVHAQCWAHTRRQFFEARDDEHAAVDACLVQITGLYKIEEAIRQQSLSGLGSHVRAFAYFCGTPEMLVPDNLKSGVSRACRYDPDLSPSYQQLAAHYQLAVVLARPY
jgi:hypothetical protein